jgi:peptide/nickel transport system permease protein
MRFASPVNAALSSLFRKKTAKIGGIIIIAFFIFIIAGTFLDPYSPYSYSSSINASPSSTHPFGTDNQGHDILSEVIFGAYPSMILGVSAAVGSVILGLAVGLFAGYYDKLEGLLTGTGDVILTFPPFPLMILIGSVYPVTLVTEPLIIILVLWPAVARPIRSQVLSLRQRPFVEAARTSGMKDNEVILKIMLPQVFSIAFAYFVLNVAASIVLVTSLEFLGVGNPDIVSWGTMLYFAQQFAFYLGDWWWIAAPGLSIAIVAASFALIGFSAEEVMNPRLRV